MADRDDRDRRRPRPAAVLERIRELRYHASQHQYDAAAWERVIDDLRSLPIGDETRQAYEEVLQTFPTAVTLWIRYADAELSANNTNNVKAIFSKCLLTCQHVDLWSQYLKFIRRTSEARGPEGLAELRKAYEFTLDCLGQDVGSGPLWQDYIGLLQAARPGTPAFATLFPATLPGQEEVTRATAVRRAYQRCVVVPCHMLDTLWRNYEQFEQGLNKQLGRRILDEWRPRYQAARATYRDRKRKVDPLSTALLALPPGEGGLQQEQQAALWREYIEYEKSNPQRLDGPALSLRVALAFDQALLLLHCYPDVWYDYAQWHAEGGGGGLTQAAAVLTRAVKAVPDSLLLRFAAADIEELQGRPEAATAMYEAVAALIESEAAAAASARAAGGEGAGPAGSPAETFSVESGALFWIQYMRFLRRQDAMEARRVFIRARKWQQHEHHPRCAWQIYAAMALSEWQVGGDSSVARNVFEKGLEDPRVFREPSYVLEYHRFLCSIGDTDNARALFERVLADPASQGKAVLWQQYELFEHERGNMQAALQVERRARAALGESPRLSLTSAVLRYHCLDLWPATQGQQRHLERVMGVAGEGQGAGAGATAGPRALARPLLPSSSAPPREPEPIKQLPHQLGLFIHEVGPFDRASMPSLPDPELVIQVLLGADLSYPSVLAACQALDGGQIPAAPTPRPTAGASPGPGASPLIPGDGGAPSPYHQGLGEQGQGGDPALLGKRRPGPYEYGDEDDSYGGPAGQGGPGGPGGGPDIYRMRMRQRTKMADGYGPG